MGSKWTRFSIGDIGTIVTGKTPKTTDETNFGADIPFITPRDLTGSRYITITERSLSKGGADTVRNSIIPEDTVVVSCIGSDMGKVAITTKPLNVTNQQINSIIVGNNFDAKFVYYNLSLRKLEIQQSAGGSAQPILNKTDFSNIDIWCPPLAEQRKIGKFISSFDDKIEINRQINQTLEQMAQTLFKSWFVDFDPVIDNALDAGNEIPEPLQARAELRQKVRASQDFQPLPADIRALFPAEFEESELGCVPKGWEVDSLNSIASYTSGRVDISELNLNNYISTENMLSDRQGVCSAYSLPTVQTVPSYSTGHILISNIRPYFKKIWFAHGTGGRSNDVLGFSANQAGTEDYLYNLLYQDVFFDFMMTTSKGSKMPRGDKDAIMDWPLVIPSMELRRFYSLKCKASRSFGEMHRNENRTLEQLRDTLLPKLISGELRLDEIPSL